MIYVDDKLSVFYLFIDVVNLFFYEFYDFFVVMFDWVDKKILVKILR